MNKKLNISSKLDFSKMDLTAPDKVVEEFLLELPDETQGIISGSIERYDGYVTSYTTRKPTMAELVGNISTEKRVDIQNSLGKKGEQDKKFECFLYTSLYKSYKYRLFFMKYGIANYPVQFTLEESIAESIYGKNSGYIISCKKREEVEDLIYKILTSKKVISVMQELIRIYQSKESDASFVSKDEVEGNED